ncbi:MAG: sigma-54-dependent Fis family transcriptional regulator [Sphingomonadales bacterium]|jgi:sigma-54 specific flagellar transcriptional regulator A|nr:sigma-54-dependent Fis family transcriptional regulator [Sphingomonadales bacterium]MBK9005150.1 sigma-54-dependent Fis family transcriptional regulator [Sphingomonadales bacterium]MBK9267116.1 sigma-54-dependent Fis family transcriptional regulator [Sphingomonadales bacterium]MBP6433079.1 sigma-54-dependent Fis family transcriptional regulator [Sphingorhabdus sp.]
MAVLTAENERAIASLVIGTSPAVQRLRAMIARVAASDVSVLLAGPSGSGKELVAQAIHAASARRDKAFVAINTGAIPGELIESELFGHEKGSFTGAHSRRTGHFENADKGTLFLDEIGDMRFDMQVKLLRVLEERVVTRVGSSSGTPVDVRIISATHRDMDSAIADGRFRQDLFFRLGVVLVQVPSLAERAEDIPLLVRHFQKGKPAGAIARFDESALDRLMAHGWPGNVRELRNVVERAGVLYGGEIIDADDVDLLLSNATPPLESRRERIATAPVSFVPAAVAPSKEQPIDLRQEIEAIELDRITMALELADGIVSEAARLLTLKRTTLIEKMRKYGVQVAV